MYESTVHNNEKCRAYLKNGIIMPFIPSMIIFLGSLANTYFRAYSV
jgi:hypothetical protein